MESKQQKARDNVLQLQVETMNVGLSKLDVENMLKQERELLMRDMQLLAIEEMDKRLSIFGNIALEKIVKAEVTNSFSDPAIQIFLRDTERAAVSSERELDYEVLSELLIHRVENKNDFTKKAALKKIVDNISLISDEALLGITLLFLAESIFPMSGNIEEGLQAIDDMYKNIISNNELPHTQDWINNLEILGLVKIVPFTAKMRLDDYYFKSLNGYFCTGIKKDTEQYSNSVDKLKSVSLPLDLLSPNNMIDGYVRLPISKLKDFDNLRIFDHSTHEYISLNEEQKNVLDSICDDYDKSFEASNTVKDNYKKLFENYTEIQKVISWYNEYTKSDISLNLAGEVLAHCNAKRLYSSLPDVK